MRVYHLPGMDGQDTPYLLRVRSNNYKDLAAALRSGTALASDGVLGQKLQENALSVPHFFLRGPKMSQALLEWRGSPLGSKVEIVIRHEGHPLRAYTKKLGDGEALMRDLLAHPGKLDRLFDEAAYIGRFAILVGDGDRHPDNIIVKATGGGAFDISHIDMVSMEDMRPYGRDSLTRFGPITGMLSDGAEAYTLPREYITWLGSSLISLANAYDKECPAVSHQFKSLIHSVKDRVDGQLQAGKFDQYIQKTYPEWKGFQHLSQSDGVGLPDRLQWSPAKPLERKAGSADCRVKAVGLSDPPAALFKALDRLYKEAVPGVAR
jgi:hypothetical protein